MHTREHCEQEEVPMVSLANACAYPWAVMIVNFNTGLAIAAVEGARRTENVARSTFLDPDLLAVHHANEFHIGRCVARCRPTFSLLTAVLACYEFI